MPTITVQISDEPVLTLPADLAAQAGLAEGEVQVILGERSLTLVPVTPPLDYGALWPILSNRLREQADPYITALTDQRDAEYWAIVTPLFEEAEHMTSTV